MKIQIVRVLSFLLLLGAAGPLFAAPLPPAQKSFTPESSAPRVMLVQDAPQRLENALRDQGYRNIQLVRRTLMAFVVTACLGRDEYRLRARRSGRILSSTRIGSCNRGRDRDRDRFDRDRNRDRWNDDDGRRHRPGRGLRPREVRRELQRRGFNRIRFIDRELPVYVVEACRHGRHVQLRLNRFARVINRHVIGRCGDDRDRERGYSRNEIEDILQRRGYREIDFFDRSGPRYGVTACRRAQKFRMRINRYAEIIRRVRVGWCRPTAAPTPDTDYEIDDREIDDTSRIDPDNCKLYLDALVHRDRIHFDYDSAQLRQRSYPLLRRLSRVMKRCPDSEIEISGHTDSTGSREYNQQLSEERVISVARFLFDQGIAKSRMVARGYGEDKPLVPYEQTERDKALNRRIEFTVLWGRNVQD